MNRIVSVYKLKEYQRRIDEVRNAIEDRNFQRMINGHFELTTVVIDIDLLLEQKSWKKKRKSSTKKRG